MLGIFNQGVEKKTQMKLEVKGLEKHLTRGRISSKNTKCNVYSIKLKTMKYWKKYNFREN